MDRAGYHFVARISCTQHDSPGGERTSESPRTPEARPRGRVSHRSSAGHSGRWSYTVSPASANRAPTLREMRPGTPLQRELCLYRSKGIGIQHIWIVSCYPLYQQCRRYRISIPIGMVYRPRLGIRPRSRTPSPSPPCVAAAETLRKATAGPERHKAPAQPPDYALGTPFQYTCPRAPIAQLVELRTFNPQVPGSSPGGGTLGGGGPAPRPPRRGSAE